MSELTWIVDPITGNLLVEGLNPEEAPALTGDLLPSAREFGCARPLTMLLPPAATVEEIANGPCVRIAGYYHNSLIEGPGRRSTVKFQGCPIRCRGCITPDSWDPDAGVLVTVKRLAQALLDPDFSRDGVSIVGGEPFQQAQGLGALVQELRACGCPHILIYSGYRFDRLRRMTGRQAAIAAVLDAVDVLIDGPFVAALADSGGAWTGSGNQRVIDLAATRKASHVILCAEPLGSVREATRRRIRSQQG